MASRPVLFAAALSIGAALLINSAQSGTRSQQYWGGADFPFSCDTVRSWRAAIRTMSAERRADLAKQFNITRKQRRQAAACLRGR